MPKVVPEYKELAKKKIIDAAYSIFCKKGYHSTTMENIAIEVGVSKASLYSYFKSKEEILQATVNQDLIGSFNKFFDNNSVEALKDIYNSMWEFEGALHLNFEIIALSYSNDDIRTINMDYYKKKMIILTDFIQNQQKKGYIRNDTDASTIAQFLNAIYNDIAMKIIMGIDKKNIRRSWNNSMSLILENNKDNNQKTLNKYF